MILFCGSSALVKLYLHEDGSDTTRALAAASDVLAVCRIAWFEFMSALARHQRERPQDAQAIASARKHLEADWPNYLCLEVTQELAQLAGDYADTFALRAYDALQLAAAELARREMPGEGGPGARHRRWLMQAANFIRKWSPGSPAYELNVERAGKV